MVTPSEQLVVTISMMPVLPEASKERAEEQSSFKSQSIAAPVVVISPVAVRPARLGVVVQAGVPQSICKTAEQLPAVRTVAASSPVATAMSPVAAHNESVEISPPPAPSNPAILTLRY